MLRFIVFMDSNTDIHTKLTDEPPLIFQQTSPLDVVHIVAVYDAKFDDPKLQKAFDKLPQLSGQFDPDTGPIALLEGLFNFAFQAGFAIH